LLDETNKWLMRFSSPIIVINSCLECTDVLIMTPGDICSFVHETAVLVNPGEVFDGVLVFP